MNAFFFSKDVRQHLWIPLLTQVTKMNTSFEEVLLKGSIIFHLSDLKTCQPAGWFEIVANLKTGPEGRFENFQYPLAGNKRLNVC